MPLAIKRALSAAFALTVLAGLMIHASVTSGCSSSTPLPTPEAPTDAATADPAVDAPPASKSEETFFPASKAGPMHPRKSPAPANQNAAPNQK